MGIFLFAAVVACNSHQHLLLMPVSILQSTLVCPHCGNAETLTMPTDACVYFHECAACHVVIRPKAGDCCVFCSFGSQPCPPMQSGGGDGCGASSRSCDSR